jgi:hypothetical protein
MEHLEYLFGYLKGTKDYGLRAPLNRPDVDLFVAVAKKPSAHPDLNCGWEFYCGSDFAGNPTESNNRRSQVGFVALLNGAPVLWGSKVSSVAFAHPKIGEAHPDMPSSTAEVYAAGSASFDFLHLSYIASKMAIDFPEPLLMDNKVAEAFTNKTALIFDRNSSTSITGKSGLRLFRTMRFCALYMCLELTILLTCLQRYWSQDRLFACAT